MTISSGILLKIIFPTALIVSLVFQCEKNEIPKTEPTDQKLARIEFYDSTGNKNIDIIAEIVEDEYHRARGLMFRENLPDNQGMLFIFDDEALRYFWMKNTTISLDIIYLNANLKIVKIHKNTTPLSEQLYPSEKPAEYVVEVRSGFTDRYQVMEGDSISWHRF